MADKPLKKKQLDAINYLVYQGYSQKKAADKVGVDEATIWRWMQDANFRNALDDEQRRYLLPLGIKAIFTLNNLLSDESVRPSVRYQVAKDLADRAGYKPVDKVEQTGGTPTFIINAVPAELDNPTEYN